jgi:hypothetical protein
MRKHHAKLFPHHQPPALSPSRSHCKPTIPVTKREAWRRRGAGIQPAGVTEASGLPREQPIGVLKGSNDGR